MWMRTCPNCGSEVKKAALDFSVQCICGWNWGSESVQDMEELVREGELVYVDDLPQAA